MADNWLDLTANVRILLEESVAYANVSLGVTAPPNVIKELATVRNRLTYTLNEIHVIELKYAAAECPVTVTGSQRTPFVQFVEDVNKLKVSVGGLHAIADVTTVTRTLTELERFTANFIGAGPHGPGLPPPSPGKR